MKIAFRVDAGKHIGTGHVMRCKVLANSLRNRGAEVVFICRVLPGDMIHSLHSELFHVIELRGGPQESYQSHPDPWLTVPAKVDAVQTWMALQNEVVDLLIVDNYGIDYHWEEVLAERCRKIMVIDDLANRFHRCDILLDQNLKAGFQSAYKRLIVENTVTLLGPKYALVRPEFAGQREASLARRSSGDLKRLLICMGGSDPENEVLRVVQSIQGGRRRWAHIDVVVGDAFEPKGQLRSQLHRMPAELHIQTADMARLMVLADFAVTGGGSITWEKCTLGLPSVVAVLAENQRPIAESLHLHKAQITVSAISKEHCIDYAGILDSLASREVIRLSQFASSLCNGNGAELVSEILIEEINK